MNFESGGKPTAKILTVWNILLKSGILMTVPSSNTGFDNSPRATPATIAIRYGNKLPYFAMISNILYLLLFFSQNGEKLKNASNNVPASVATGAVISWLPSDNCPCNTVIGAAIRIPPLIEFGTPFTNLSASFVIPININTNATRSYSAIIACILSGPFSNPFKYARVNGSVGVIHPGTTGSPNHP